MTEYDIFMQALKETKPELASVVEYIKETKNSDKALTFEDCRKVEEDIHRRLTMVNPFGEY